MVRLMLVGLLLLASAAAATATVGQAKEGCLDKCGDVSIPYPFGTNEEQCYLSPYFLVTCNHSSNPPKLLLGKPSPEGNNVQVLDISLEGELLILNYVSHDCYNRSGGLDSLYSYGSHLTPGQFNSRVPETSSLWLVATLMPGLEVKEVRKATELGACHYVTTSQLYEMDLALEMVVARPPSLMNYQIYV